MARLTKTDILQAVDLVPVEMEVPEWGDKPIALKPFSGLDRQHMREVYQESKEKEDHVGFLCFLLAISIVDDEGKLIFSKEDIDVLKKKNVAVVMRVGEKIREINGLGDDELKRAQGNLGGAQSSDSGSPSPSDLDVQSES